MQASNNIFKHLHLIDEKTEALRRQHAGLHQVVELKLEPRAFENQQPPDYLNGRRLQEVTSHPAALTRCLRLYVTSIRASQNLLGSKGQGDSSEGQEHKQCQARWQRPQGPHQGKGCASPRWAGLDRAEVGVAGVAGSRLCVGEWVSFPLNPGQTLGAPAPLAHQAEQLILCNNSSWELEQRQA